MSYIMMILSALLLISCATREPANDKTWKQANEEAERADFINRAR